MIVVVSVHRGRKKSLKVGQRQVSTGITKNEVPGRVTIHKEGLLGDAICDARHHGGSDQAIYVYRQEDYDYWHRQYPTSFPPGGFGENLLLSGLDANLMIGDRLTFEDLELEVSAPRIPCSVLGASVPHRGFSRAFQQAERPGFYCRVLKSGTISAGDLAELERPFPNGRTLIDLFRANYAQLDEPALAAFLDLPIDARTRRKFETKRSKLLSASLSHPPE